MKKTWRPAWPHSGSAVAPLSSPVTNTVNSSTLPITPTGQAQTMRRMPSRALASPKRLPTTSRDEQLTAGDGDGAVEQPVDHGVSSSGAV